MVDTGKPRVLVVEDDDDTRNLFTNFLEYEGCDVDVAKHPDGVADPRAYSVIVMDVQFGSPSPAGVAWVQAKRHAGMLEPATKIIFTTGFAADQLSVPLGDHVLPKPIELTALRKLLSA